VNPYAFFVGCPRSGTTLLGRIGNAHPLLAIVHETRWIPRCFESREGLTEDGLVTPRLAGRLCDERVLGPLAIDADEMERLVHAHDGAPFATFVTSLFDRYGERERKRLVGDKSPGYVRYLPMLHALWPEARFVHIIRDGRDVCLSVLDWRKAATRFSTFERDPFTTTGVWWEWYVELGREAGRRLGPRIYHELRYESLVAEPEREVAELCAFLGIPSDDAMLRFHVGKTRVKPGRSAKSSWLPVTQGLRDWRTQLDADAVLRFEAAAGHVLEELGYPRSGSITSSEIERAARLRERFAQEARARGRPLPHAWTNGAA
jgi:hypothetical protein